jgi:transcriptional regulator with XRE-family HTH domain
MSKIIKTIDLFVKIKIKIMANAELVRRYGMEESRFILASNVKELLHKRGMQQKELADLVGVSRQHINAVLAGRANYSDGLLVSLARVLDVDKSELLNKDMILADPGSGYGDSHLIWIPFLEIKTEDKKQLRSTKVDAPIAFKAEWLYQLGTPEKMVFLRTVGDNLDGLIPDSSMVMVDRSQTRIVSGFPYLMYLGEDLVIKRVTMESGAFTAHNDRKGEKGLVWLTDPNEWDIVGRCVWYSKTLS